MPSAAPVATSAVANGFGHQQDRGRRAQREHAPSRRAAARRQAADQLGRPDQVRLLGGQARHAPDVEDEHARPGPPCRAASGRP